MFYSLFALALACLVAISGVVKAAPVPTTSTLHTSTIDMPMAIPSTTAAPDPSTVTLFGVSSSLPSLRPIWKSVDPKDSMCDADLEARYILWKLEDTTFDLKNLMHYAAIRRLTVAQDKIQAITDSISTLYDETLALAEGSMLDVKEAPVASVADISSVVPQDAPTASIEAPSVTSTTVSSLIVSFSAPSPSVSFVPTSVASSSVMAPTSAVMSSVSASSSVELAATMSTPSVPASTPSQTV